MVVTTFMLQEIYKTNVLVFLLYKFVSFRKWNFCVCGPGKVNKVKEAHGKTLLGGLRNVVQVQYSEWLCGMIHFGMVWSGVWIHLVWFFIYSEMDVSCMVHTAFNLQSDCKCKN
jgi:hypothetical protein